jgi:hypothetical protein
MWLITLRAAARCIDRHWSERSFRERAEISKLSESSIALQTPTTHCATIEHTPKK